MVKSYGTAEQKLVRAVLPVSGLASAGSIVRSFAEIEDIVNLWITRLAQTTEGISAILMGKLGLSGKLKIAEYLAKLHGPKVSAMYDKLFGEGFDECITCRNAMAHGVLLGKGEKDGKFAFLTNGTSAGPAGNKLSRDVISYDLSDLKIFAAIARKAVKDLEKALGLEASRKRYLQQSLLPHRKGQPKGPRGGGRKPPQNASQQKPQKLSKRERREQRIRAVEDARR